MSEFSETIYIRSDDRSDGVQWLQDNDLIGYVYEPRGGWVQVLPGWSNDEKIIALKKSSGFVIYYCYAEDQFWSFLVYQEGKPLFSYEAIWEIDEYLLDGAELDDLAQTLRVSPTKIEPLFYTGDSGISWDELAEKAAVLADLLNFPNYAFASFDYAQDEPGGGNTSKSYVGPDADYQQPSEESSPSGPATESATSPQKVDDAPWQAFYNLASQFLKYLHDEELIELTLDTRLVRDRLIERLTQTVIENPVSSDSQLIHHWLENLMTAPEIVDVYATDEMITDAYERAKNDIQASASDS